MEVRKKIPFGDDQYYGTVYECLWKEIITNKSCTPTNIDEKLGRQKGFRFKVKKGLTQAASLLLGAGISHPPPLLILHFHLQFLLFLLFLLKTLFNTNKIKVPIGNFTIRLMT